MSSNRRWQVCLNGRAPTISRPDVDRKASVRPKATGGAAAPTANVRPMATGDPAAGLMAGAARTAPTDVATAMRISDCGNLKGRWTAYCKCWKACRAARAAVGLARLVGLVWGLVVCLQVGQLFQVPDPAAEVSLVPRSPADRAPLANRCRRAAQILAKSPRTTTSDACSARST